MKTKKALLIIDMQKGSFTPETPRYDSEDVVHRINELADRFRTKSLPVIFIQHQGIGAFEKGTREWEILDELDVRTSDLIVSKTANDAFYKTELDEKLSELGISELFITGCATDFCVESTIQSALVKDYNITVVEDGHTTGERPFMNSKSVIQHYNWVWSNLTPTNGLIQVKPLHEISFP